MRISLIHGEDTAKAYQKYTQLLEQSKSRGFKIVPINDVKKIVAQSLFDEKQVYSLTAPNKIKLADWKWLKVNASKYNSNLLIFWDGNVPVTVTRNLPADAKLEKFELPKIIFTYLDAIYLGNAKRALKLFNDLVKDQPVELVLAMTARHLRDVFWAKASPTTMKNSPWIINKLKIQSGKFEIESLKKMINNLAEIDVKVKTTDSDLKTLLDKWLVESLE